MQEADEQDTCRICSAPAEPDQPLFHPCKCSGTIRYIHQDCLTTWLAHSKKKNCDVCKHQYSFTKVYAANMPNSLPAVLLVRRLIQQIFLGLLVILRAIAVAIIWLGVVPWITVWTWRMYFVTGDSMAWWISDRPRPLTPEKNLYEKITYDPAVSPPESFLAGIATHPAWLALYADIFTGQIIASLIVLIFVAIFLLREWISQNARPGVFEEEEPLPDAPAQNQAPPPDNPNPAGQAAEVQQGQPNDVPNGFPGQNELIRRQEESMRALNELRQRIDPEIATNPDHWFIADENRLKRARRRKGRIVKRPPFDIDEHLEAHEIFARRQMMLQGIENPRQEIEYLRRQMFLERVVLARAPVNRDIPLPPNSPPPPPPLTLPSNFNFTFKPRTGDSSDPVPSPPVAGPSSQPQPPLFSFATPPNPNPPRPETSTVDQNASPFPWPPVALQPPAADIPFSLRRWQDSQSNVRPPQPVVLETPFYNDNRRVQSFVNAPPPYEETEPVAGPSNISPNGDADNQIEERVDDVEENDVVNEGGEEYDAEFLIPNSDMDMVMERDKYFRVVDEPQVAEGEGNGGQARPPSETDSDEETEEEVEENPNEGRAGEEAPEEDLEEIFGGGENDAEELAGEEHVLEGVGPWVDDVPGDAAVPPAAAQRPNQNEAGAEGAEEVDNNVEDDMEGAMEAIGMRGPFYGVFQNAALMIFVLDTAIGLGVWVPFTTGKTTALLTLDPRRMLQVLHLPIRAMRLVTDPIVDFIAYIIVDLFFPQILQVFKALYRVFIFFGAKSISTLLGKDTSNGVSEFSLKIYTQSAEFISKPLSQLAAWSDYSGQIIPQDESMNNYMALIPDYLGFTEPYFEILGRHVRLSVRKMQAIWIELALGSETPNRVFAIMLGYAVVGLLFCLYLNVLTVGNARTAGLALRNAVRQQLLVLKVAAFIFIELVIFPLGCGIVLDLCTIWLFPQANINSRMAFFSQAPLTAMFYHWVAGTMFMYSFAVLLSGCRGVMRAGAMWFIKDPQDQNSHPIRDILERPTFSQLRKILVSGIMYSFVVACVVGSVASLLALGSRSILPFRWKNREPLSNVPVDLLFLHLVLPYTMHYFRPKKGMKKIATQAWWFLATRLRLTSYFFGGRHLSEEYTKKDWLNNWFRFGTNEIVEGDVHDGCYRRVPATDNVALPRDMRATVAVTLEGEPVDEEARQLMALQDAEAAKAKRNVKDDYMIVYIPPHFKYRIILFIVFIWIFGAFLLGVAVAAPIKMGRNFFRKFTPRDIHDGYSFIVGFYIIWIIDIMTKAIIKIDRRRQRRGRDGPRAALPLIVVKRGLLWFAKTLYMAFFLGIIIPVLLAIVVDLYIVLPIRFKLDQEMLPRIRVVDAWALGLLYAKIALHAHRIQPQHRISRGLQHIMQQGWTRPDPISATKEVIAPITGGLLAMILLPVFVFRLIQNIFPDMKLDNRFMFMMVYPSIFVFAGTVRSGHQMYKLLKSWSQAIRDKEFLVEMRLRNHEPVKINATLGQNGSQQRRAGVEHGVQTDQDNDDEIGGLG